MAEDQKSKKAQADRILAAVNVMIHDALVSQKLYSGDSKLGVTKTSTSTTLTEKEDVR